MLVDSLTVDPSTVVSSVLVCSRPLTGRPGAEMNGNGAMAAPGTALRGSCGSDDGRGRSFSDTVDESLADVARGIRPSAKSNATHTHTHTNFTENRFSFNDGIWARGTGAFKAGGRDATRRGAVASSQMRRFVPLNYRRGWAALTPGFDSATDKDQTTEMAATVGV